MSCKVPLYSVQDFESLAVPGRPRPSRSSFNSPPHAGPAHGWHEPSKLLSRIALWLLFSSNHNLPPQVYVVSWVWGGKAGQSLHVPEVLRSFLAKRPISFSAGQREHSHHVRFFSISPADPRGRQRSSGSVSRIWGTVSPPHPPPLRVLPSQLCNKLLLGGLADRGSVAPRPFST